MSSYSSSSFSGPSSPISTRFVSRTDRQDREAPRSPRARPSNQRPSYDFELAQGSPRRHGASKPGLSPIHTARTSSPRPSPRTQRPLSHASRLSPSPRIQAHLHDEPARRTRRFAPVQQAQVPHASPLSPVLPLPLHSLPAPSTPPQRPRESDCLPSPASTHFLLDPGRVHCPVSGLSTPLSSPRSQRQSQSTSSTPSRPPPSSFPIRRAIVPAPTAPTLAMSIPIHAPTPITSSRPTSPRTNSRARSSSRPRPTSPMSTSTQVPLTRPPMPRPPSRSERLLRDTLRRADEHERLMALSALPSPSILGATQPAHGFVAPPPPRGDRRTRTNTSSSTGTDVSLDAFAYCDSGACYSDEEEDADEAWLWRSPSGSSSSSSQGHQGYFQRPLQSPPRHRSDDQETQRPWRSPRPSDASLPAEYVYGSPSSPSPTRAQLRRSARSAPSVSRSSMSQQYAPFHAFNTHNSSQSPPDGERSPSGAAVTPHEAVLRSRLEGVLRGAKREQERSREREYESGSNSMASSRNMSGEGDWFFGQSEMTSSPDESEPAYTSPRLRAHTLASSPNARNHRSPSSSTRRMRSPGSAAVPLPPVYAKLATHNGVGPLTPPPTPPFNALSAAAQCKSMDGYVSFADIEGLGLPPGEDEDVEGGDDSKRPRGWLKWLPLGTKPGRGRSDSACSVASR